MRRRTLCTLLAMSGWANSAVGQPLAKTTTIIVPFAPGGSGDITARLIGQFWLEAYGLTVVVETKPGANGMIGMQSAKNAPADGKTLVLATTSTLAANPSLFRSLPYDAEKDFTLVAVPICRYGTGVSSMPARIASRAAATRDEALKYP